MHDKSVSVAEALHNAIAPLVQMPDAAEYVEDVAIALYLDYDTLKILRDIVNRADKVGQP